MAVLDANDLGGGVLGRFDVEVGPDNLNASVFGGLRRDPLDAVTEIGRVLVAARGWRSFPGRRFSPACHDVSPRARSSTP